MRIRARKFEQHDSKIKKQVVRKQLNVEIRVGDQILVFRMSGAAFLSVIEQWIEKFPYDYFKNPSGGGLFLRPIWQIEEIEKLRRYPGKLLKYHRQREGLSQKALAELVGSTQANVAYMEKGHRNISKKMAECLGRELDVDPRVFLQR